MPPPAMRPADRLFQIILMLRNGRVLTARRWPRRWKCQSAPSTATSLTHRFRRTDRRRGGRYYRLRRGYQVPPPHMFTGDELEALVIGAKLVQAYGDPCSARPPPRPSPASRRCCHAHSKNGWPAAICASAPDFIRTALLARTQHDPLREGMEKARGWRCAIAGRHEVSLRTLWPLGPGSGAAAGRLAPASCGRAFVPSWWTASRRVAIGGERFDDRYGELWRAYLAKAQGEWFVRAGGASAARRSEARFRSATVFVGILSTQVTDI